MFSNSVFPVRICGVHRNRSKGFIGALFILLLISCRKKKKKLFFSLLSLYLFFFILYVYLLLSLLYVNNMTVNSSVATASFFTSFNSNKRRPSLGLPTSPFNRSFLQSPLWNTITTTTTTTTTTTAKPIERKTSKKKQGKQSQQQQLQQAIYVLPKSPSNVSIYLQLPTFRSLSVMMRCGHVSRLVENWLCNPMEQLKRNAERAYQQQQQENKEKRIIRKRSSSLCLMPAAHGGDDTTLVTPSTSTSTPLVRQNSTPVVNNSLVRYQNNPYQPISSLFIHFQTGQQSQPMEIQYNHVPCLFTIVCVTYHCGSVSVSINQIESLDFLSSTARMNPFLVKCDLLPNHPVTIHQLTSSSSSTTTVPQICDYAAAAAAAEVVVVVVEEEEEIVPEITESSPVVEAIIESTHLVEQQVRICGSEEEEASSYLIRGPEKPLTTPSELLHLQERYHEEEEDDDDDDESCLYSSSEEFSIILDDLETEGEEDEVSEENAAQAALLRLVQDTLEYIQSSGGALSDELNQLEYKLYNYSRAHATHLPCL